jgi:hypothetical protein
MDGKQKIQRSLTFLDSAATEEEELSRDEGGAGGWKLFLSCMK